jgi:hypothetical protein
MSGWDTSSRPSWEQPEGQEDSTQAFSAPDLAPGADDPWPVPAASASPPPEFFPDFGQQQEPPRPGFRADSDLPRRGRHHAAADGAYGRDPGYGQDGPYGQDTAYGAEADQGLDNSYGHDAGYGQDAPFGQDSAFGQDAMPRQESATGWDRPGGRPDDRLGDRNGGRPGARAPWEDGLRQDPGQGPAGPLFDAPDFGRGDSGTAGFGTPDFGRGDAGHGGFDAPEFSPRDPGFPDPGRGGMSRELDRRDAGPGRGDVSRELERREPGASRSGWGQQAPSGGGRAERESAARMDPALQDFFAPQQQQRPGVPPSGNGRRVPGASLAGSGLPGPGLPGPGQQSPGLPGGPGRPAANGRRPATDGWGTARDTPAGPPRRAGTLPPRRPAGGRPPADDDDDGNRRRVYIIGGAVAVLVIIAAVFFTTHHSNSSNTDANTPPTVSPTASATKHAAKPSASAKPSGPVYTLSTPATAGGYPMGQDPHFLATATTTAQSIVAAVKSGGGGTVKGAPVSASYQLPAGQQVIEFVGYQGTFTPAKVASILATLGSDPHSYPAGPNGGILGCANTTGSASGAVCVWATTSTLGVTEFFSVSGPEALTDSQSKGAKDVVSLRSSVETAKKS